MNVEVAAGAGLIDETGAATELSDFHSKCFSSRTEALSVSAQILEEEEADQVSSVFLTHGSLAPSVAVEAQDFGAVSESVIAWD